MRLLADCRSPLKNPLRFPDAQARSRLQAQKAVSRPGYHGHSGVPARLPNPVVSSAPCLRPSLLSYTLLGVIGPTLRIEKGNYAELKVSVAGELTKLTWDGKSGKISKVTEAS